MKKIKYVNIFWTAGLFSKNTGTAADLLVAEESMAGLGSAAAMATATARERGEKYNLLHEIFPKLGAPLTVVLMCFYPRGRYVYIGRKTFHLHVN
jgi:hypothetical protein